MELPDLIDIRSDVMMGKPCLKGTRIPVYLILEKLGAGESATEILEEYPYITPGHLQAVFQYAAKLTTEEIILRA